MPDLTAPDFWLWECLKCIVYAACPHCNQDLKVSMGIIRSNCSLLQKIMQNFVWYKTMYYILWKSSGTSHLQKEGNRFCTVINMLATTSLFYCSVSHSSLENTVISLCTALYSNNSMKLSSCQAIGFSALQDISSLFRNSNLH